jgi:hypothetical protein
MGHFQAKLVLVALITVSSMILFCQAAGPFKYSESPTLDMIPDGPITGEASGKSFAGKTIVFQPSYNGKWEMIIADVEFSSPTDIIMSCQHIDIDLPEAPATGKKLTRAMKYGDGIFQIQSTDDPKETTSWNADNAWVIEFTSWDAKPWNASGDMFQQCGTASGKIAVCYKGSGSFKNSWAAGTFKNAPIRYMGEPPASIKNAPAQPAAGSSAGASAPAAPGKSAGTWKAVGKAGDWKQTIAGVGLNGKLYTIESSGSLYVTDPSTGTWKALGKPDFAQTAFITAAAGKLFTIEKSGTLFSVNPADGSWQPLGPAGGWANTIAATSDENRMFTVESVGTLYATDTKTGVWKQLGKPDFAMTSFIFYAGANLYTIESSGTLYKVNPADGSWSKIGNENAWTGTIAGAVSNGKIFTVQSGGGLFMTVPETGVKTAIGNPDFAGTQFMFSSGKKLYTIEKSGSLYEIDVE